MNKIIVIILIFWGCTSKEKKLPAICNLDMTIHQIYPLFEITIDIPTTWTNIDSTMYVHKHLVKAETIYNNDSSSHIFIHVLDFKNDAIISNDTTVIKSGLLPTSLPDKSMEDSIVYIKVKSESGWNTVFQKTVRKNNFSVCGGQIVSVKDNKQVKVIIIAKSAKSSEAANTIDCIMKSYKIMK